MKTETINKVCASGLRSVTLADQIIRSGDEEVIVAGGMESMSNAPYILPKARWGLRMGDAKLIDSMIHDGLTCSFTGVHMGHMEISTAEELGLSREAQDEWAYRSHQKAIEAIEKGIFAEEIVPFKFLLRKGDPIVIEQDESPRKDTSIEKLAKLAPAFSKEGTITAGNAPGVNDGAGALVLMSEERAEKEGKTPFAYIVGSCRSSGGSEGFPENTRSCHQ